MDLEAIQRAVRDQSVRVAAGIHRIDECCAAQDRDESHCAVIGPQLTGTGAGGEDVGRLLAEVSAAVPLTVAASAP